MGCEGIFFKGAPRAVSELSCPYFMPMGMNSDIRTPKTCGLPERQSCLEKGIDVFPSTI